MYTLLKIKGAIIFNQNLMKNEKKEDLGDDNIKKGKMMLFYSLTI